MNSNSQFNISTSLTNYNKCQFFVIMLKSFLKIVKLKIAFVVGVFAMFLKVTTSVCIGHC